MKKNAIYIVFLTSVLALTGCSGKTNQSSNVEQTNSTSNQEVAVNKNIVNLSIGSIDELNEIVEKDITDTIDDLTKEHEQLQKDINTYDEYVNNVEKIEVFYNKVKKTHQDLCIRMREYSIKYAENIMALDISNDDKYDELDVIYDIVYDDYGDDIYDEVYDGFLDDMYDFYDHVIGDAYEDVAYKEWSKVRSQEYEWWSDTRSDVYEQWSDYRSDVYEFGSDLRGEIWSDDIDKAKKVIEDFKEDITMLKEKSE